MKFFPKVQSACPYKGALSDILDADICRLCKREVHDLTDMGEDAKRALFAGCSDDVCVTYRLDARPVLAAAAMGASVMLPTALAAQDVHQETFETALADDAGEQFWIIVGGARKNGVEVWQNEEEIREERALPVVYEDAPEENAAVPEQAEQEQPKQG